MYIHIAVKKTIFDESFEGFREFIFEFFKLKIY